jgi:hypothetical protein
MTFDHYEALLVAYFVGLSGWLLTGRIFRQLWPVGPSAEFEHPWREFGFALIGAVGVLGVGQLWSMGIRLPETGMFKPVFGALNQALIFTPILLVPIVRRQPWETAWLPSRRFAFRLLAGLVLSSLAVTGYAIVRSGADAPWLLIGRIWRYEHLDELVQVFLEDVTIAILFVRLAGAIGRQWATVLVAALFAAGHIPAMLSGGANWSELGSLLGDTGLGVAAILVLQRSRDIVWFWCIHFCLDMTQFAAVSGVG